MRCPAAGSRGPPGATAYIRECVLGIGQLVRSVEGLVETFPPIPHQREEAASRILAEVDASAPGQAQHRAIEG